MNLNLTELKNMINEIEARSSKLVGIASNGKAVLREDLERYNALLELKKVYENNRETIRKYNALVQKSGIELLDDEQKLQVEMPVSVEEKLADEAREIAINNEEQTIVENEVPQSILEPEQVTINPSKEEVAPFRPMTDEEIEASRKKLLEVPEVAPKIIQDLPLLDRSKQIFHAPAMSHDEILASRNILMESAPKSNGPVIDPVILDGLEELQRALEDDKPSSHDEFSIDELDQVFHVVEEDEEEQKSEVNSRKKVKERSNVSWKESNKKKSIVLNALLEFERKLGFSEEYLQIAKMINDCHLLAEITDYQTNHNRINEIDAAISSATDLSIEEKRKLYKKLNKLVQRVSEYRENEHEIDSRSL